MTITAADAETAAIVSLKKERWLMDTEAGRKGLHFNLMCETGFYVVRDDNISQEKWLHRFTVQHPERVIELARAGDRIAHDALCYVVALLNDLGRYVPQELQRYLVDAAPSGFKKPKRGRHPVEYIYRDEAIFRAVETVIALGIPATRNPDGKREVSA